MHVFLKSVRSLVLLWNLMVFTVLLLSQMVVQLWLLVQAHHNFPKAEMQTRITQWLVQADQEAPTAGRRKTSSQKLMGAWKRMTQLIMTMIFNTIKQSAMDHSLSRNKQYQVATASPTEAESKSKKTIGDGKVRRGIGRPLRRSNACKTWHCEPSKCAHDEDKLRQRGTKDTYNGGHVSTAVPAGSE